jgi:hypothetical protein
MRSEAPRSVTDLRLRKPDANRPNIFLDTKRKYVFNAAQRFVTFEGVEPPNHYQE